MPAPSYDTRDKRLAVRVENHPLEYRHFGDDPKGRIRRRYRHALGRGTEPHGDVDEGLYGSLKFVLRAEDSKGMGLVRLEVKAG